jgi:glyoxylase-like metal-dependent hydrolase (beta-lactamase superfamily II)
MLQIKQFTFSPLSENTYVLYNENKQACIIDPGCYTPEEQKILEQFITSNNLKVELLLLTHAHLDHVFGLNWAAEQYDLQPYLHVNEWQVLERGPMMGMMYGLPFPAYTGPTLAVKEGDTLQIGEDKLKILFAPGHSPGHVCYFCAAQGFVIGGDVLFQRSIGRTDLPGGNHQVLLDSIRTQLFTLPESTVVHSGHGPSTTIGEEKRFNPFLN